MGVPAEYSAGCPRFFVYPLLVPWKKTHSTYLSAGKREVRDNFMGKSAHPGLCMGFLLLISKSAFYRWLNFAISCLAGGFTTAEMDFQKIFY